MTKREPFATRYPEGTRLASYRWHDPQGRMGIDQGPVIEVRVYVDPKMRHPERLEWELRTAFAQLQHHIQEELNDHRD